MGRHLQSNQESMRSLREVMLESQKKMQERYGIEGLVIQMLDIDEIISHELDMATCGLGSSNRAKEHEQIARWLMELKERRAKDAKVDKPER